MNRNSSKRILAIACIILAAVIIGMLLIRDRGINTDVTAKTTKVGLILAGVKDDNNFCQTHYDALMRIRDELNLEILIKEQIPEEETAYRRAVEELIGEGCRIIVAASYGYNIAGTAENYPDVCFLHMFGNEELKNLSSAQGRMYQARYLAGIASGLRSETKKIGYVAAFPVPEVICQLNAFTLGVKSVSPEAQVFVRYCNSWVEDETAGEAAEELFAAHPDIDVLSMHTNSLAPDQLAEEKGIWHVGFNYDNREMFPKMYLGACEWTWDPYYKETILSFLQGKFDGKIEWLGVESGTFGLSELTENAADGTKEAVKEAEELFKSRRFDVFYGPVRDNQGAVRIPEGESMSDDEMLNYFDWYVEGIEIYE